MRTKKGTRKRTNLLKLKQSIKLRRLLTEVIVKTVNMTVKTIVTATRVIKKLVWTLAKTLNQQTKRTKKEPRMMDQQLESQV